MHDDASDELYATRAGGIIYTPPPSHFSDGSTNVEYRWAGRPDEWIYSVWRIEWCLSEAFYIDVICPSLRLVTAPKGGGWSRARL